MKKCYIVGAGEFYGSIDPCENDLIIAADGGMSALFSVGIIPHVLIGDFDSLDTQKLSEYDVFSREELDRVKNSTENSRGFITAKNGTRTEFIRHPVMKDETDAFLAYKIGTQKGYTDFYLYGGVGGREDHTFANYCLLLSAKNENNSVYLIGNGTKTYVIKNEEIEIFGRSGKTVSVFAFCSDAGNVSITGLKYEARSITLSPDYPLGVSNSYTESGRGKISVGNGALLIIEEV